MTSRFDFCFNFHIMFFSNRRISSTGNTLVMLIVHNLDHMMQPHEWETLLTREIHSARVC
jgi:hypothetical protein